MNYISFFLFRKKSGWINPMPFWGCGPKMLQMKVDHTKGAIILKHAINNSENKHGAPKFKKHIPLKKENIIFRNLQIVWGFKTLKKFGLCFIYVPTLGVWHPSFFFQEFMEPEDELEARPSGRFKKEVPKKEGEESEANESTEIAEGSTSWKFNWIFWKSPKFCTKRSVFWKSVGIFGANINIVTV